MSKHLPRFYTNTYCLRIDEGTRGGRRREEKEEEEGRPVERMGGEKGRRENGK